MARNWKAEAKKAEAKIGKLRKKLKAQVGEAVEAVSDAVAAKVKAAPKVSPLAPAAFPALPVIAGVDFAAGAAGVRYRDRTDVMLVRLAPGTTIAGAFTRSATRAASVLDCEAKLGKRSSRGAAILVNSGNANAFTGAAGMASVEAVTGAVAARLDVPQSRVFTSSTGVIGEPLPHEKIVAAIDGLTEALDPTGISAAARAIMTTDTFPKGATATVQTPEGPITIAGIAKGSGMIAPDMATMLVYIFTDARIPQAALQKLVTQQVDRSFNCITVDGDTSTSDALIVAATGQGPAVTAGPVARGFAKAMGDVMLDLAKQVVRDGEGATKFAEIRVTGAADAADARKVAMAIANSPLVKTALAGEDANWGRIVMAVGKSGARADRDLLTIRFGNMIVAKQGWRNPRYNEARVSAYMKNAELLIAVDLGLGRAASTVWTCDLTHGYIDINADYRS